MLANSSRFLRPISRFLRSSAMSTVADVPTPGPVEASIRTKLESALSPTTLTITNDSWQHRHHAAMRAQGGGSGETHFSVHVVSDAFTGKPIIQRHRMIYNLLSEEMDEGLHALSLKTKTTQESAS